MIDNQFSIKDLGPPKYFLKIKVARSSKGIFFVNEILSWHPRRYGNARLLYFYDTNGAKCLTSCWRRKSIAKSVSLPLSYRSSTLFNHYLIKNPFTVNILSQFMQEPRQPQFEACWYVLHYLKGSLGKGSLMASSSPLQVIAYADSDWKVVLILVNLQLVYAPFLDLLISPEKQRNKVLSLVLRLKWTIDLCPSYLWIIMVAILVRRFWSQFFFTDSLVLW